MDLKLTNFIAAWDGKPADFDKRYGAQCFDVIQYWSNFLGGPFISGAIAKDIAHFSSPFYTWVPNSPTNVPSLGDIIVWKEPYGKYIDTDGTIKYAGHTGVVVAADVNKFIAFEQNDPAGSVCHIQEYNNEYFAVMGWLHPNIAPATTTQAVADTTLQDAVTACQTQLKSATESNAKLQEQITNDGEIIAGLRANIATLQGEIEGVKYKYDEDERAIISLKGQIITNQQEDKDYAEAARTATNLADKRLEYLKEIMDAAGITYDPTKEEEIMHEIAKTVVANRDNAVDPFLTEFAQFLKDKNIDGALETLGHSPLNLNNLQDAGERQKIFAAIEGVWSFAMSKDEGKTPDATAVKAVEGIATYTVKHTSFLSLLWHGFCEGFRKPQPKPAV